MTILQSWINETSQYRDERELSFGRRNMSPSTLKINGDMFARFKLSADMFGGDFTNEKDFQNLCVACGLVVKYGQLNNLHETESETAIFLNPKRMHPSYIQFLRKTYEDPRWASFNPKSSTLRWGMIKYFINPLCQKMKVAGLWFKFQNDEDRINKRRQMRSFLEDHGKLVPNKDSHIDRYFDVIFENTPLPMESVISNLTESDHNRLAQLEEEFEEGGVFTKTSKASKSHYRRENNRSRCFEYLQLKSCDKGETFIPTCEICGFNFGEDNKLIRRAFEVAHKIPIFAGRRKTTINKDFALLCCICHGLYTGQEDEVRKQGGVVDFETIGKTIKAIMSKKKYRLT